MSFRNSDEFSDLVQNFSECGVLPLCVSPFYQIRDLGTLVDSGGKIRPENGLGGALMGGYQSKLEAGHALLKSALALGSTIGTPRAATAQRRNDRLRISRNRNRVFLASKSDARDYDGFKRNLNRSLQVLRTDYLQGDDTPADARARTSTVNPPWRLCVLA